MELTYDMLLESYMRLSEKYKTLHNYYDCLKAKMADVIAELLLELGGAKANMKNSEGSKSDIMHRINQCKENEDVFS